MATAQAGAVLRHLRGLVAAGQTGSHSDGELLQRFLTARDEAAFAALVQRHGPLVLGVCRRVLGNGHDAEDAFQATFLVLANKAGSINKRESVGAWLYRVAYHTATKARTRAASRQRYEQQREPRCPPDPFVEVTGRELLAVLDEELHRLAERYRSPLVLCYLQGKTCDEAARLLGWSLRTFKRRLEQGRERLRCRLAARGLTLSAGLLAVASSRATATVPPTLIASTVRAALLTAGVILATPVVALVKATAQTLTVNKLRAVAAAVVTVCLLGAAVGWLTHRALAQRPSETQPENKPSAAPPPGKAKPDEGKEMTVVGQVHDADGKPVREAEVAVFAWPKHPHRAGVEPAKRHVLGTGRTAADGQFRLTFPRPVSDRYYFAQVAAVAPGHGLVWQEISADAEGLKVELRLGREQLLHGRLVDLQGAPAAKTKVHLQWVARKDGRGLSEPAGDAKAWPGPLVTDAEGRFVVRGVSQGHNLTLNARDDRYAFQELSVPSDHKDRDREITFVLAPPKVLHGRVTYADTDKPVAGARLLVMAPGHNFYGKTDAEGRYELAVSDTTGVTVYATPPEGEPYLTPKKHAEWPKGTVRLAVDLALPRGVVLRGKVTETASGKAVAGANVQFFPQQRDFDPDFNPGFNPNLAYLTHSAVASGPDGAFAMALPPGPGHLLVNGPAPDYVYQETAFSILSDGRPNYGSYFAGPEGNVYWGGQRVYAHAVVPVKLKPKAEPEPITVTLRRGVTVAGKLLGADGKPAARAWMLSRLNVSLWEHMVGGQTDVHNGRFELRGCDPEATYRVHFFDPVNEQGAVVEIAGKQAGGEPVTVRLAPCGTAKARLIGGDGRPLPNGWLKFELVVTPGAAPFAFTDKERHADALWMSNLDWQRYGRGPRSDKEARLLLPALIPGATYRFLLGTKVKEFSVEAGKTLDLGDLKGALIIDDGSP